MPCFLRAFYGIIALWLMSIEYFNPARMTPWAGMPLIDHKEKGA
jgi:hypothetical protein